MTLPSQPGKRAQSRMVITLYRGFPRDQVVLDGVVHRAEVLGPINSLSEDGLRLDVLGTACKCVPIDINQPAAAAAQPGE